MDIVRTGYLLQVVVFAGATAIACCAPELVRVFAPETGYTGAAFVIPWIAYSYAIHGAVQVVNAGIGISKRTVWSMWTMLLSVAFKLAVTYWFILHYGIVGAAASTFLAFAFGAAGDAPQILYHYAELKSHLGDRNAALQLVRKAVALDRDSPDLEPARLLLRELEKPAATTP